MPPCSNKDSQEEATSILTPGEVAITAFEQSLVKAPNAVEPLVALVRSLVELGKSDEALARVQRVVDASPEHFPALNLMG